jgi:hypothetical protein
MLSHCSVDQFFASISDEALHETKMSRVTKEDQEQSRSKHNDERRDLKVAVDKATSLADMLPLLEERAEKFGNTNRSQSEAPEIWINKSSTISPFIQDDEGRDETNGPFAVWWQYSPVIKDRSTYVYIQPIVCWDVQVKAISSFVREP